MLASACAPVLPPTRAGDATRLLEHARSAHITLEDPMTLDAATLREVREAVGGRGEPVERLRRLDEYLKNGVERPFAYSSTAHLDAQDAFRERRGDCMSYALLFSALSRQLGIHTHFVHAREVLTRYERAGSFFVSSHVAVGYGTGPTGIVVDFSMGKISDWNLTSYEVIDDATAYALHYNNVAVELMLRERTDVANRLFSFLLEERPHVPEIRNNLAVLLNRERRYQESLALLQDGIRSFPTYTPFYTNAILAAESARRPEVVLQLETKGRAIADSDPFFLFARALRLYDNQAFREAAAQLERASSAQPDSPVISAWLSRAYMSAGDRERAREAFAQARRLAPGARVVRDLLQQFPELGR